MPPKSNCPNCGAAVAFRWSSAVQTACEFCHSILVRRDVDLEKVGEVADLPDDASPIQLMTEGTFDGKSFTVVGRIVYSYAEGAWNEWHIMLSNGVSGWLSDAQLQYAVSFAAQPPAPLPPAEQLQRGQPFLLDGVKYETTVLTRAHYEGFEGDLPFTTTDRSDMSFADLRTTDRRFGTIDYSEDPPLLFLGRAVGFDELKLRNLREFEGW